MSGRSILTSSAVADVDRGEVRLVPEVLLPELRRDHDRVVI